ncbi:beta-propeller domain-containing protein [Saccharomonospora sp. NPDC046836]|uniref:beta-propeller domain-containing protein n=1 Tax=Saccharomonospora sp. NPDC046836 TaxID=3156921 RepID=UPI003400812D
MRRAVGVLVAVVTLIVAGSAAEVRDTSTRLVAFASCDEMVREVRAAAVPIRVGGGPGEVALPAATSDAAVAAASREGAGHSSTNHSGTNNHEAGVEEPDLVQTDGRRVVTVADGRLRVIDAATRTVTSTVDVPGGPLSDLLLDGNRVLLVAQSELTMIDISGPARAVGSLAVSGRYLDARLVDGRVRIVVHSTPPPFPVYPHDALPRYTYSTGGVVHEQGPLVDCGRIYRSSRPAGAILTVLTVDMAGELRTGEPVAIAADGNTVYGTERNLYVASTGADRTEIHQFDIAGPGPARYVASGSVPGALLNQYSMSEYDGRLRVATTTGADNTVTVLERRETVLAPVGSLGGLGKGERIYAVRFLGPTGYVVTFRETDPLYTLDLGDPAAPRATGELKITGYSAYLHSVGPDRLLGVGQEADQQGRVLGLQVSLFDVGDAARPARLTQYRIAGDMAQVESDSHAFLYWQPSGLLVLPTHTDALVLRLAGDAFTEVGTIGHSTPVLRSLVIGSALWTVSQDGIQIHDATRLTPLGSIVFG